MWSFRAARRGPLGRARGGLSFRGGLHAARPLRARQPPRAPGGAGVLDVSSPTASAAWRAPGGGPRGAGGPAPAARDCWQRRQAPRAWDATLALQALVRCSGYSAELQALLHCIPAPGCRASIIATVSGGGPARGAPCDPHTPPFSSRRWPAPPSWSSAPRTTPRTASSTCWEGSGQRPPAAPRDQAGHGERAPLLTTATRAGPNSAIATCSSCSGVFCFHQVGACACAALRTGAAHATPCVQTSRRRQGLVLDVAHVIEALQQLDVGSLCASAVLAATGRRSSWRAYAQLRRALNTAFEQLRSSAAALPGVGAAAGTGTGGGGRAAGAPLRRGAARTCSGGAAEGGRGQPRRAKRGAAGRRRRRQRSGARADFSMAGLLVQGAAGGGLRGTAAAAGASRWAPCRPLRPPPAGVLPASRPAHTSPACSWGRGRGRAGDPRGDPWCGGRLPSVLGAGGGAPWTASQRAATRSTGWGAEREEYPFCAWRGRGGRPSTGGGGGNDLEQTTAARAREGALFSTRGGRLCRRGRGGKTAGGRIPAAAAGACGRRCGCR